MMVNETRLFDGGGATAIESFTQTHMMQRHLNVIAKLLLCPSSRDSRYLVRREEDGDENEGEKAAACANSVEPSKYVTTSSGMFYAAETRAWMCHTYPYAPARMHGFWSLVKYFKSKNQILLSGFRQNGAATSKATTRWTLNERILRLSVTHFQTKSLNDDDESEWLTCRMCLEDQCRIYENLIYSYVSLCAGWWRGASVGAVERACGKEEEDEEEK